MDQEQRSVELKQLIFNKIIVVILVISVIASGIYYFYDANRPIATSSFVVTEEASYPINKVIRYSFLLKNTSNQLIKQAKFSTYAPVKQTASQLVRSINASDDFTIDKDLLGNQLLNFKIKDLPPFGSKVITITVAINLNVTANKSSELALNDYLIQENFIEVNHPHIQALANRLASSNKSSIPKSVYDWVSQKIRYAGYVRNDQGALYALQHEQGDCTEYMYLAAALLRASAIPARGVAGFIASENKVLNASDYHNWTEYYQNGRWHLLDAQKKVFDKQYQNYIAFRVFGIKGKHAMSQSQRFLSYDSRLSVKMN